MKTGCMFLLLSNFNIYTTDNLKIVLENSQERHTSQDKNIYIFLKFIFE